VQVGVTPDGAAGLKLEHTEGDWMINAGATYKEGDVRAGVNVKVRF
jgi:hypothetical protein